MNPNAPNAMIALPHCQRWPGDSQRESPGDSRESICRNQTYFQNARAIRANRLKPAIRNDLNPWFGEPVVCTLDSRSFRNFRGFRESST